MVFIPHCFFLYQLLVSLLVEDGGTGRGALFQTKPLTWSCFAHVMFIYYITTIACFLHKQTALAIRSVSLRVSGAFFPSARYCARRPAPQTSAVAYVVFLCAIWITKIAVTIKLGILGSPWPDGLVGIAAWVVFVVRGCVVVKWRLDGGGGGCCRGLLRLPQPAGTPHMMKKCSVTSVLLIYPEYSFRILMPLEIWDLFVYYCLYIKCKTDRGFTFQIPSYFSDL